MLRTSMGQLLVNDTLPEALRDYDRVMDKKGQTELLRRVALEYPDQYVEISKKLADIGRYAATESGGNSFGLSHMTKAKAGIKYTKLLKQRMQKILERDDLDDTKRHQLLVRATGMIQENQMDEILAESSKENNPFANQVLSGSRGNKMNLASLRGSDGLYSDHRDEPIPLPVTSSYSEGLRPIEYWAGTYGARKGVIATKFATQDAGFLSKQLNQVSHRLMVVDEDDPRNLSMVGLPVDTGDMDNEGTLLAHDVGGYKKNTVLTPKILKELKRRGNERILVRSPLVGGSPDGGVYARDVGVRERGTIPGRGEQVGLTAAQSLSEPLQQGQLSAKHSGGVTGQEKSVSGFQYLNQLIQVPKSFKGGAAHSTEDGTIERIDDAPAGGKYVWINGKQHYVSAGFDLKVKRGDRIEAGDVLSDGQPNPQIITQYKGTGEGKRYFVNAFVKSMQDSGLKVDRRNVELLSRGLINHVELTDEFQGHTPGDVLPYSTVEHLWQPREDHQMLDPRRALGKYLEKPVLHYSIGTKIRPSVLKDLQYFGVKEIAAHNEPPPFQSQMIRGMASLQHDPDWMTRMYGSGQKASLLDAVHSGAGSNELGTSFVPGLARAVDFGRVGQVRPPEPGIKLPPEGQPLPELNVAKRKPTDKPTSPIALNIQPKVQQPSSFVSRLGSMFKSSIDTVTLLRSAHAMIEKIAATDAELSIQPGSKPTLGAQPQPKAPAPAPVSAGPVQQPQAPMRPRPAPIQPATQNAQGLNAAQPAQQPVNPGQVHPGRQPQQMRAWAREGPSRPIQTDDPNLLETMPPEQIEQFIGDERSGLFARAMRVLSLGSRRHVNAVTGGSPYVQRQRSPSETHNQGSSEYPTPMSSYTGGEFGQSAWGSSPSKPSAPGENSTEKVESNWLDNVGNAVAGHEQKLIGGVTLGSEAAYLAYMKKPLAAGMSKAVAINTGINLLANTPDAVRNYGEFAKGNFRGDEATQKAYADKAKAMGKKDFVERAFEGLNTPASTWAAGGEAGADAFEARQEGMNIRSNIDRQEVKSIQALKPSMDALASKHERWIAAGRPSGVWTDPETNTPYTQAEYDDYKAYQARQGQTAFQRDTKGLGGADSAAYDAASTPVSSFYNWATGNARIPGTNRYLPTLEPSGLKRQWRATAPRWLGGE